jgi:hydrogenase maturation protein HypF
MAEFDMCLACRREYEDPSNRRFHAQPVACPACGPKLILLDSRGSSAESEDPLARTVAALREGLIVAIKGLGGFHLACRADREDSVRELRRRKNREEKPFAVMVQDVPAAQRYCAVDATQRQLLESAARPIMLLGRKTGCELADAVAPASPNVGVMLPYTPLHYLLVEDLPGIPLVMTSGNRSDEPIAYENDDAVRRLAGIADLFLVHNRRIHVRCDDSVVRTITGRPSPVRRSRGYAPQALKLPVECPQSILAVGGQLKATFALGQNRRAILSHHLGDLDHLDAYRAFVRDIELYQKLFESEPRVIGHDLHPDYASTRYALEQRDRRGIKLIPIQHHHAHVASCMAEHGLDETVIGVSFDGTGFGADGAVLGGEFLVCDYVQFRRAAHLRYVPMPGGDRAIHEPWRMALAHLRDAGVDCDPLRKRVDPVQWRACHRMIERRFNSPPTSSSGRLFDAVASLIGLRDVVSYEAQAAMELEWLAADKAAEGEYPFDLEHHSLSDEGAAFPPLPPGEGVIGTSLKMVDTRPLLRAIVDDLAHGVAPAQIARRFHFTLAKMILEVCRQIRSSCGISRVVLSGGAFINEVLTSDAVRLLEQDGFVVFRHEVVPTGDGGLSLGQLAIAAAQLRGGAKD